jgi:hypothetical protein
MRFTTLLAAVLAAAIASPAPAMAQHSTPMDSSKVIGSAALLVPFSLIVAGSVASEAANKLSGKKRWRVAALRPQGAKTGLELRSEDDKDLKLEMAIDTRIAQQHTLQVNDELRLEAVGKTGYEVRKGGATIALLAEPGSGMLHSKARS